MQYQTVNAALAAIIAGAPAAEVAADIQGQMDYAISYYSCEADEAVAMRALRAAYTPKAKPASAPAKPAEMKKCSCGCTVPACAVMSASLGSSCPDCYDGMSA